MLRLCNNVTHEHMQLKLKLKKGLKKFKSIWGYITPKILKFNEDSKITCICMWKTWGWTALKVGWLWIKPNVINSWAIFSARVLCFKSALWSPKNVGHLWLGYITRIVKEAHQEGSGSRMKYMPFNSKCPYDSPFIVEMGKKTFQGHEIPRSWENHSLLIGHFDMEKVLDPFSSWVLWCNKM